MIHFGKPRRARREQDEKRVIEREARDGFDWRRSGGDQRANWQLTSSSGKGPLPSATAARSEGRPRAISAVRPIARASAPARQTNSTGSSCRNRLRTAAAPISGAAEENIAPSAAVARATTAPSMSFRITATTRSPGATPSLCNTPAACRTISRSCRRVTRSVGRPSSCTPVSAGRQSFSGSGAASRFST